MEISVGERHLAVRVTQQRSWRMFVGRREAHLLNGSYCFSDERFLGDQSTPWIDTQSDTPGEGWEETADNPPTFAGMAVVLYRYHANIKAVLPVALKGIPLGMP